MRKITLYCCLLFLIPALGNKAFAQDSPKPQNAAKAPETPVHYYHLEFVVQETGADDKPTNSNSKGANGQGLGSPSASSGSQGNPIAPADGAGSRTRTPTSVLETRALLKALR